MVQGAACRRHRGAAGRGLQPHAEGDEHGPTLSWRGLDNASWYRLPPDDRSRYDNWSGCGNTLDVRHPRVLQMVMDSLRYWVQEMHVDGFRFDLATVLGRGDHGFDREAPFFKAVPRTRCWPA
jgi:pullulanase/glycogen debranching enzyme